MSSQDIRKAVIPAAGLGTRLLPFTKTVPKEMLPIAGKPLIQLAVEEAVASGIETVVLVINETKNLVGQYSQRDPSLEQDLERRGKSSEAAAICRWRASTYGRCRCVFPPHALHAYLVEGLHHDSGGLLGYLQAELAYGLKNPTSASLPVSSVTRQQTMSPN